MLFGNHFNITISNFRIKTDEKYAFETTPLARGD